MKEKILRNSRCFVEVLLCGYALNVEENLKEQTRDIIVVRQTLEQRKPKGAR